MMLPKLEVVFLTLSFLGVQGGSLERFKRALPPAYLSVEGFEQCMVSFAQSTAQLWCFPLSKPLECTQEAWKSLGDLYKPPEGATEVKLQAIGAGGLPPPYLGVEGFKDCLGSLSKDTHSVFCLPPSKPQACLDASWAELQTAFVGEPCNSGSYQDVAGFDLCLSPDQGSPEGWCIPLSRPAECLPESWDSLKTAFQGGVCKATKVLIGSDLGARPPAYLSLSNFADCLATFQAPGSSHSERCLPSAKPDLCPFETWQELLKSFDGIGCPKPIGQNAGPPAYLSVPNFNACLKDYEASPSHSELCLPREQPADCPKGSWDQLKDVFVGLTCPPLRIATVTGLPPAWLSIPGHRSCLQVYQAEGATHQEWCYPQDRPEECSVEAWDKLAQAFTGSGCPSSSSSTLTATRHVFPGKSELVATKPAYLQVPDFELCLNIYQVGASALSEYCLPQAKPANCPESSWNQLRKVFTGIRCSPAGKSGLVSAGPPAYLSVPSFKDCLGDHPSPSGTHTEYCLPVAKPENCPLPSWNQLIDPQIFTGIQCALNNKKSGAPEYLSVNGFQDCLGVTISKPGGHSEWCLPEEKAQVCSDVAWEQIKDKFQGLKCEQDDDQEDSSEEKNPEYDSDENKDESQELKAVLNTRIFAPGFINAMPPAYLSVEGFEKCLGIDSATSNTHTTRCLPKEKPEDCLEESWTQIQASFDGGKCPIPEASRISHIEGHEVCLKEVIDSKSKCVTLTPEDCPEHVHGNILQAVFAQRVPQSSIVYPASFKTLNSGFDWSQMVPCDQAGDCLASISEITTQCTEVSGREQRGVCAPLECTEDAHCPSIGEACSTGVITGVCNTFTKECNYSPVVAIANCVPPPPSTRTINYNKLVACDTSSDCPFGIGKCQPNEVAQNENKTGICVPQDCSTECPTLGALCTESTFGMVSGVCQDVTNTCDYSNGRILARCTAPEQRVRDESNDNQLVFCDTNLECPPGLDFCHANFFAQNGKAGVCGPQECDANNQCPSIGDVCVSGSISGNCNAGQCNYEAPVAISNCVGLIDSANNSSRSANLNLLLDCNTDADCPADLEACNVMSSPTSSGKLGYCVAKFCTSAGECPNVGDECQSGSILGACNSGICNYDREVVIANCVGAPGFETPEVDYKVLNECDSSADCPQGLDQCNNLLSPTDSGKSGICVPSICVQDTDCPKVGDDCASGSLSGRCDASTGVCDYNKVFAIATCTT